jgi:hypothetical protein
MTHARMVKATEYIVANINESDVLILEAAWKQEKKEAKAARKKITDALFFEAQKNKPVVVKEDVVIADDAAKYSHVKLGIGLFVSEDEKTITLSFSGKIKVLVKAFNKLTKI